MTPRLRGWKEERERKRAATEKERARAAEESKRGGGEFIQRASPPVQPAIYLPGLKA